MWLEQLALLYNQAYRNSTFAYGGEETQSRWMKRCEKLYPILDAEMKEANKIQAKLVPGVVLAEWVNGYAIVYPDVRTKEYAIGLRKE